MRKLIPGHIITPSNRGTATDNESSMSVQFPLILLSLSAAIFLGSQIRAAYQGESIMRWQLTNADNQITNVQNAEAQMAELIKQREDLVKQSTQIQTEYTNLLNSVIELAKTDEDARQVVAKWKIQRSEPPASSAAPAEASTPEPAAPSSSSSNKDEAPPEGGLTGTAPSVP